jgi:predicted PurR-regulated permease PerM
VGFAAGLESSPRVGNAFAFVVATVALYLLYWAQQTLLVAFIGVLSALVIDALAGLLQKIRVPRPVAVGASGLILFLALAGTVALVATPLVTQGSSLVESLPQKTQKWRRKVEEARTKYPVLAPVLPSLDTEEAKKEGPTPASAAKAAAVTASGAIEAIVTVFAVIFLGVFLALDPERYVNGVARLLPGAPAQERVALLGRIGDGLRSWLLALGLQIIVTAVLWTAGLWVIGIPYALLFGIIAGLVEIVPYLGPMLGLVLPLAAGATESAAKAGAVVAVYAVIHVLEGYVLVPFVMQKREHLPPPVVLLSIMGFGAVFGVLGVVVAVPLGTIAYIWITQSWLTDEEEEEESAPSVDERPRRAA